MLLPITQSDLQLSTSLEIMRELFIKRMISIAIVGLSTNTLTMLELKISQ